MMREDKRCAVTYREVTEATHNDSIAMSYQRELADFLRKATAVGYEITIQRSTNVNAEFSRTTCS